MDFLAACSAVSQGHSHPPGSHVCIPTGRSRVDLRGSPQPVPWPGVVFHPELGGARRFCIALMQRNLSCKDTHWNVIRLAPPLVITREENDWALDRLEEVLQMP